MCDHVTEPKYPTCEISVGHDGAVLGTIYCRRRGVARIGRDWLCLAHLGEAALKFDSLARRYTELEHEHIEVVIAAAELSE